MDGWKYIAGQGLNPTHTHTHTDPTRVGFKMVKDSLCNCLINLKQYNYKYVIQCYEAFNCLPFLNASWKELQLLTKTFINT